MSASGAGGPAEQAAPRRLVLATHNAHKVEELRRILGSTLEGFELVGYDGPEPVEDGETFAENALIKARAAAAHTGLAAIADDSGISVEALGGAPGIHSARFAGTRNDADNLALLVERMHGVEDRRAHYTCAAAFVDGTGAGGLGAGDSDAEGSDAGGVGSAGVEGLDESGGARSGVGAVELVEVGIWSGTVLLEPAGSGGFGYDPVFRPDGLAVSAAELPADEKNAISHRALAFSALIAAIRAAGV